jgi:RsiW-degrading membrane proteinase PrsW (M82 family)
MTTCPHCGNETPEGHYCGYCGARLTASASRNPARRGSAYAADPNQSVYQPAIISTFFPHLNPQRTRLFGLILAALAVVIFALGFAKFVPISTVLAALLVPLLYLAYFYVVQVYEDEPAWVLGATFLVGAILGLVATLLLYRSVVSGQSIFVRPKPSYILLVGVGIPLLAQALMLVGPLILFFARRERFNDMLDGLTFGVASGLGYAAAESIVYSWLLITGSAPALGDPSSLALRTIPLALLKPLLYAGTTGLICAALWLLFDRTPPTREMSALTSLPVALIAAVLGMIIPALGVTLYGGQWLNILWYAIPLLGIILLLRQVLHVGLIDKARSVGHGGTITCPHCHQTVADLPFCSNCGIAMRSISKRARVPVTAGAPAETATDRTAADTIPNTTQPDVTDTTPDSTPPPDQPTEGHDAEHA